MKPFTYTRAATSAEALQGIQSDAKFLGGGTNLLDLMKMGVEHPAHLIDIARIPFNSIAEREVEGTPGIRIGAMMRNSDVASNQIVRQRYPLLSQALLAGASPQIRNMATVGGNLLQRTRCYYFYDPSYSQCNKRKPGSGCAAINGVNRIHAILGGSEQCIAVHPSDMAVAMAALNAKVVIQNAKGERSVALSDFYRLPGTTPQIETVLTPGDLIVAVDLPAPVRAGKSDYLKIRDRNSFAFALVSVAAIASTANGKIQEARLALGGIAPKPWRLPAAEEALRGQNPTDEIFHHAADLVVAEAKPHRYNGFKVELTRRAIVRALQTTTAQTSPA